MVDAAKINMDMQWFSKTLSTIATEFSLSASKNTKSYVVKFVQRKEFIASRLRAKNSEFSTGPDEEYVRHVRLLFHAIHNMVECVAAVENVSATQKNILRTVEDLVNELRSVENIDQIKGYYNQLIAYLGNLLAVQEKVSATA